MGTYVVYDSDCGFCTFSKNFILVLGARRGMRAISIGEATGRSLLGRMDFPSCYRSFHLVTEHGSVYSSGQAAVALVSFIVGREKAGMLVSQSRFLQLLIHAAYGFLSAVKQKSSCGHFSNDLGK